MSISNKQRHMLKDLKLCIAIFYLKHFETSFILNISSKSEAWHLHPGMSAHGMQMECMFHLPPNVHENLATATVTSTSALIKGEDNRGPKIRAHRILHLYRIHGISVCVSNIEELRARNFFWTPYRLPSNQACGPLSIHAWFPMIACLPFP